MQNNSASSIKPEFETDAQTNALFSYFMNDCKFDELREAKLNKPAENDCMLNELREAKLNKSAENDLRLHSKYLVKKSSKKNPSLSLDLE